jgi:hypothetical protein
LTACGGGAFVIGVSTTQREVQDGRSELHQQPAPKLVALRSPGRRHSKPSCALSCKRVLLAGCHRQTLARCALLHSALCGMLAVVVVAGHASPRRTRNALYVRGLLAPELTIVPFPSPSPNTLPRWRTARIPDSPHDASGRQMCSPSGSHRSRPVAPCDQILQICVSHVKRSPAASRDRRHNKKQCRASSRCPPAP